MYIDWNSIKSTEWKHCTNALFNTYMHHTSKYYRTTVSSTWYVYRIYTDTCMGRKPLMNRQFVSYSTTIKPLIIIPGSRGTYKERYSTAFQMKWSGFQSIRCIQCIFLRYGTRILASHNKYTVHMYFLKQSIGSAEQRAFGWIKISKFWNLYVKILFFNYQGAFYHLHVCKEVMLIFTHEGEKSVCKALEALGYYELFHYSCMLCLALCLFQLSQLNVSGTMSQKHQNTSPHFSISSVVGTQGVEGDATKKWNCRGKWIYHWLFLPSCPPLTCSTCLESFGRLDWRTLESDTLKH